MSKEKIQIKLVRSANKQTQDIKDTVKGLGLRKINSTSELSTTPSVLGMIRKVNHLIKII